MYNMYSRDFAGPTFGRLVKMPLEENDSCYGVANGRRSRAQIKSSLVPHEEVPGSNSGRGKQLVFF